MCIWRVSHSLMIWKDNLQPNCWNKWLGSGFFWRSRKKHKFGQFSHSLGFYSLQPHGLQHTRLPGPSPNPRAYSNSCPLIGDAIKPSHPLLSPSSPTINLPQHQGLFQWVSSLPSGGQSVGVSASASVLPMNTQDWFPWGWTGWISLRSKGLSWVFSNTTVQKHQFFGTQLFL